MIKTPFVRSFSHTLDKLVPYSTIPYEAEVLH